MNHEPTSRLLTEQRAKPAYVLLSYVSSFLALVFISIVLLGKQTVLYYAAQISPYSMIFANEVKIADGDRSVDDVIFFFGDSSVVTVKGDTALARELHIPSMLESELNRRYPELGRVSVVEWAFIGAHPFHYYCMLFAVEKYKPSLVIAPVNWRALGAVDGKANYKFPELIRLVPARERIALGPDSPVNLEGIPLTDQFLYLFDVPKLYMQGLKEWARSRFFSMWYPERVDREATPAGTIPDNVQNWEGMLANWPDSELFATYPVVVPADHLRVKTLRLIADTAWKRKTPFLFYITPIHTTEMAKRESFDAAGFRRSVETVIGQSAAGCAECVNFIELLDETNFVDFFEHYSVEGNRKVAEALAPEVRRMLLKYKKPAHK